MIDYRINYDQGLGNGDFIELVSGLTEASYTAIALTRGLTYTFVVQARNIYGYSSNSVETPILAAQRPDTPTDVTSAVAGDYVTFSWVLLSTGGSAITAFRVYIRQQDGLTYT